MLTSENGIRESHSGQKYGRIDIPNRKLTKVCLTAPMASHWRKYDRVRISRVTLPPSLMAPSGFIADGLAAAESRFALLDEGANGFLVVGRSGCPNQILRFLIH
jgi:hypothetical protein